MALIKCPECGKDVSDKAKACPKCGYPIAEYVNGDIPSEESEGVPVQPPKNNKGNINKSKIFTVDGKKYEITEEEGEGAEEVKQWYVNLKELTKEEMKGASIGSAIFRIFRTEWITKVVWTVLKKVKEYPLYGEQYYNILTKKYIDEEDMKDEQVVSELDMDRATFYRRKKEAILLCGILMWEEARDKKME